MKALRKVNEQVELRFKRLTPAAQPPLPRGAGNVFVLRAAAATVVPPRERRLVPTGLSFELPAGSYAQIVALHAIVLAHFVDLGAGIIDSDYRGEVQVLMINHGEEEYAVAAGQPVAELAVCFAPPVALREAAELAESERAEKGFGSSGIK